eukprot:GHVT01098625.1.p2 GENE.GHVT01098625.1~~GHVT01098625.1.p2  ORF type:complete len:138 (+),score=6.33 GHVT01098625.1:1784-2197(+)
MTSRSNRKCPADIACYISCCVCRTRPCLSPEGYTQCDPPPPLCAALPNATDWLILLTHSRPVQPVGVQVESCPTREPLHVVPEGAIIADSPCSELHSINQLSPPRSCERKADSRSTSPPVLNVAACADSCSKFHDIL